ncbi:hypothetical protein ABW20_dc0104826 [Dactylellina cionopaga]|nr:hypothetical protein ABW20_dc0104826 [Dactylellina cionopaga]
MRLLSIPYELTLGIIAYLDFEELCNFSACSKPCREICLPTIFRSIKLYPQTCQAFQNDGSLAHIRYAVRKVFVNNEFGVRDQSTRIFHREHVYHHGTLCEKLGTRLTGNPRLLSVGKPEFPEKVGKMSVAVAASGSSGTPRDIRLSFNHTSNFEFRELAQRYKLMLTPSFEFLSDDNRRFLGLIAGDTTNTAPEHLAVLLEIRSPIFLEEATFNLEQQTLTLPLLDKTNPLSILQYSSDTLRTLELVGKLYSYSDEAKYTPKSPFVFPFLYTTFPNVKRLGIHPRYATNRYFGEFVWRFPNVETLRVMVENVNRMENLIFDEIRMCYGAIPRMKNLKTIMVPGLIAVNGDAGQEWEGSLVDYLLPEWEALAVDVIDGWIRGGLRRLEKVAFVKRRFPRAVSMVTDPYILADTTIVKIIRGGEAVKCEEEEGGKMWKLEFDEALSGLTKQEELYWLSCDGASRI